MTDIFWPFPFFFLAFLLALCFFGVFIGNTHHWLEGFSTHTHTHTEHIQSRKVYDGCFSVFPVFCQWSWVFPGIFHLWANDRRAITSHTSCRFRYILKMQTNVQIDSKNLRSTDDNFRSRGHHITIEVSVHLTHVLWCGQWISWLAMDTSIHRHPARSRSNQTVKHRDMLAFQAY